MPSEFDVKIVNAAISELDKVRDEWLNRPGVSAVDVGYRFKGTEMTDELAIRVHVERKIPPEFLEASQSFSLSSDEPGTLGGFSIDVMEAKYAAGATAVSGGEVNRKGHINPLVGGISLGNIRVTAGTLGAIVYDKTDGAACILSNWHVLCGSDEAQVGESIIQPGRLDGGQEADKVAELRRWRLESQADAALARLTNARPFDRDLLGISTMINGIEDNPRLGTLVVKSGRTTGVTEGMIDGVSLSMNLSYKNGPTIRFHDQLHIVPRPPWPNVETEISRGGDSGSIWVVEGTGDAVGLHFAGETDPDPTKEYAVANRMSIVADLLNFSFKPVFQPQRKTDVDKLRRAMRQVLCRYIPSLCQPGAVSFSAPEELPELDDLLDEIIGEMNE